LNKQAQRHKARSRATAITMLTYRHHRPRQHLASAPPPEQQPKRPWPPTPRTRAEDPECSAPVLKSPANVTRQEATSAAGCQQRAEYPLPVARAGDEDVETRCASPTDCRRHRETPTQPNDQRPLAGRNRSPQPLPPTQQQACRTPAAVCGHHHPTCRFSFEKCKARCLRRRQTRPSRSSRPAPP